MALDARAEQFCLLAAKGISPTQAALQAGYHPRMAAAIAHNQLQREEVRLRIMALSENTETIASPEEILALFTQIMRGELTEGGRKATDDPVAPKIAERARAAELLGKRYGLFNEQAEQGESKSALAAEIEEAVNRLSSCGIPNQATTRTKGRATCKQCGSKALDVHADAGRGKVTAASHVPTTSGDAKPMEQKEVNPSTPRERLERRLAHAANRRAEGNDG